MSDDHPERIKALEVKVDNLDERVKRVFKTQDEHGVVLRRIETHIAEQTGALKFGKWVIGGAATLFMLVVGAFAKRFFE